MVKERLYEWLDREMRTITYAMNPHEIPEYIKANLKDELRHYQEEAFRRFQFMQDDNLLAGISNAGFQRKHLLFNMATGSGKTMVMASLINLFRLFLCIVVLGLYFFISSNISSFVKLS